LQRIDKVSDFSVNVRKFIKKNTQYRCVHKKTGEMYYHLWKGFSKKDLYLDPVKILNERFSKNQIFVENIECALDDGCGSGRYTYALKELGCQNIWGVDISSKSIELAKRNNPYRDQNVQFLSCSALKLPFEDDSFDFVFSNGVLHHTNNLELGLYEIQRVLRKNGKFWLYLYGGKDSFFWDVAEFCRKILKHVPQQITQMVMNILGYPPGRIFHRTDFFYVPINNRYSEKEIVSVLEKIGFKNYRRLNRGTEYDWDEIIFNHPDIDPYIYGEGEMRFWIEN
jgi:ubiquinone/menaquinone biosynthesis C-methylase UbiE